jgi:hypothetical protein
MKRFTIAALASWLVTAVFDAPWRAPDVTGVPGTHPEEPYWGYTTVRGAPSRR